MSNGAQLGKVAAWLVLLLLCLYALAFHTVVDSDLNAFLPQSSKTSGSDVTRAIQEVSASRTWLIALEHNQSGTLSGISRKLAAELKKSELFRSVENGDSSPSSLPQAFLVKYRYLLDPRISRKYYSANSLRAALENHRRELKSPLSRFNEILLLTDPTGAYLYIQRRIQESNIKPHLYKGVWFSKDNKRIFLVAETVCEGTNLNCQQQAQAVILSSIDKARNSERLVLTLSGAPFFALETRKRIKHEAQLISIISMVFIISFLFLVYRSSIQVFLISLPLFGGILSATVFVAFLFGGIHGITLAFGVTVLGVAVDYPVHVFSHRMKGERIENSVRRIWPTMRLGVLTTILAYSVMVWTDFTGLAQLGSFSIVGLLCAALITRYLLPNLYAGAPNTQPRMLGFTAALNGSPRSEYKIIGILVSVVLCSSYYFADEVWSKDIKDLSPIPADLYQTDNKLRSEMGVSEPRFIILVSGNSVEELLIEEEKLRPLLAGAIKKGHLKGFIALSNYLPSQKEQARRKKAIPAMGRLRQNLNQALKGAPISSDRFGKFLEDVDKTRLLKPLTYADLKLRVRGMAVFEPAMLADGTYVSVVRLVGVGNANKLGKLLSDSKVKNVEFVDFKANTNATVNEFRSEILRHLSWIVLMLVVVLLISLRSIRHAFRVVMPVCISVAVAGSISILLGEPLTIFHLVSMLLVGGLAIDYSLFFSLKSESRAGRIRTVHSLAICSFSTVFVFMALAFSSIPVLHAIGLTVASGSLVAFSLSWLLAQPIARRGESI